MLEENKAVVRRWVEEVQNQHRLDAVDEILAWDIVNHDAPGALPSPQGAEEIRQLFSEMFTAFPDFHVEIEDQIAEGDKVVTLKRVSGTNLGEFMGMPPTGKQVEFPVIDIFRVADGKCTDHWSVIDYLRMMQQLGLIPTPEAVTASTHSA
jgi:steroid delta-isomerase-like uncharacterized protein